MTGDCSEAAILTAALLRASRHPLPRGPGIRQRRTGACSSATPGPRPGWEAGRDGSAWTPRWAQYPAGVERIKLMPPGRPVRHAHRGHQPHGSRPCPTSTSKSFAARKRPAGPLRLVAHPGARGGGGTRGFYLGISFGWIGPGRPCTAAAPGLATGSIILAE